MNYFILLSLLCVTAVYAADQTRSEVACRIIIGQPLSSIIPDGETLSHDSIDGESLTMLLPTPSSEVECANIIRQKLNIEGHIYAVDHNATDQNGNRQTKLYFKMRSHRKIADNPNKE